MREVILDTETTGLDVNEGHRLIEIGACEMINHVLTNKTFHVYINPEREIDIDAVNIHGISNDDLIDKLKFSEICHEFLFFIGKNPKPCLPITQLSKILTLFLIKVFLTILFDPKEQLSPIVTFFSIIVLCPILQFSPIETLLPIKTFLPKFTLILNSVSLISFTVLSKSSFIASG